MKRSKLARAAAIALMTVMAASISPHGRTAFERFSFHLRYGTLEQAVDQAWSHATLRPRQAIAIRLGIMDRDLKVESYTQRNAMPEFKIIPAIAEENMTPASGLYQDGVSTWTRSYGDNSSAKFSSLDQINRENVADLERVWEYVGQGKMREIQSTPIYTGRHLIFPDGSDRIIAVDPENGAVFWTFDPGIAQPARRGLVYSDNAKSDSGDIYFTAAGRVMGLDEKTGKPLKAFGKDGISVGYELRAAPVLSSGLLIVSSMKPAIHVFDVVSGKLVREIEYTRQFDNRSWLGRFLSASPDPGGASAWSAISVDSLRQIVFLSTSNTAPVGVGIDRPGDNAPASSVVAISLETGRVLWTFQDVRHDLWDLDVAAPPVLASVVRKGNRYDVVVAATKSGNLLVLDRMTGRPLFDFRLRRAPVSPVPGERTSPYQPDPVLPQPFGRAAFTLDDVTSIGKSNRNSVLAKLKNANTGFYPAHVPGRQTVFFGLHGGAMHPGTSVDLRRGVAFIAASHVPSMFSLEYEGHTTTSLVRGGGAKPYRKHCAGCHSTDLQGQGNIPSLHNIASQRNRKAFTVVVRNGAGAMPAVPGINDDEIGLIYSMLEGAARGTPAPNAGILKRTAYAALKDNEGYPGSAPPWGTLTAIDLATGAHLWRVPLGEEEALLSRGLPPTGTENMSGPTSTAGGLVFVAGTKDRYFRAIDAFSGAELWKDRLPFIGSASPMTYMHNGVQYVVISATGSRTLALYDDSVSIGRGTISYRLKR